VKAPVLDSSQTTSMQDAEKLYTAMFTASLVAAQPRWEQVGNKFPIPRGK
jgi:hypothetical protein